MTICPKCKGKAEYFQEVFNDGKRRREILVECDMCHGSGKKPMTNEEWFCQLSTEEKAEVLFDIWYDGKVLAWDKSKPFYFNRFVTWLKEMHKDEM